MKNIGSYPSVRLRRNRKAEWSRRLVRESSLSASDLIWPIFIREGKNIKEPIKSMPGVHRYTIDKVEKLVEKAISKKIPLIALFPNTPMSKKNKNGTEALNKNNLIYLAAAYNGGPGNLEKWLEKINHLDDALFFMESIPSRETRWFIEKVLTKYWIYEDKIGNKSNSLRKLANGENPIY